MELAHAPMNDLPEYIPDASATFDQFYLSEYPGLVRLLAGVTGRWDVAEELAQDAFLKAHRRWSEVSGYDSPAGWLRHVALNGAWSTLKRRTIEAKFALRLGRERRSSVEVVGESSGIWRAVAALPKRQAQVLALVFYEDRSIREVAQILGCGEDTVRTHLRRGRIALANTLGVNDEGDQ